MRASAAVLAMALGLGAALATLPVHAGTISVVPAIDVATQIVPGSAQGEMRSWVQLVWNPLTRQLQRVRYSAWDPVPALGLELHWLPDDPAALDSGPVEGEGTLSFRRPGAPAYDPSATVAQYRGSLGNGRMDGEGTYVDGTGFSYQGGWRNGLMDGEGRLALANGDEYVGQFEAGRHQGTGVFIDATGAIYDGGFAAGLRHGSGIVVPLAGDAYRARFANGAEVPGSRHSLPVGELPWPRVERAQSSDVEGLRIGLIAERRPHNYEIGIDPLSYTSRSAGQLLEIFPDDQRLLDVWHGTVPIQLTADELDAFTNASTTPSFLGPHERFDPLSLVFELENSTTEPITVVGGYLHVDRSTRNGEPAMQVRPFPRDPCGGLIEFLPRFFIDNFGWAAAENASINVTPAALDGRQQGAPITVPLGSITESVTADTADQLAALGLDTTHLAENRLICTDPNDERLCLGELRRSGLFGEVADFISLDYLTITVNVAGTLDYDWRASDGSVSHKSSPFSVVLPIGSVASDAECGEGGEIIPISHDPFMLRLDESGYRIALPFSADVTPGFTSRWRVELQAPETSEHEFQLVLLLADGRQIASRPVHFTYFIPPLRQVQME